MGNSNKLMLRATSADQTELDRITLEDINATDAYGYTLLLFAARDGDVKRVRFLLENNASVDIRNDYGATALHFAASWGHRDIARLLLEHGASVNASDHSGKSPLMRAAANGDKKLMRLLLKHGADISIRDAFGYNAERLAFSAGHYKVLATLRRHELRKSTASDDTRWSQRSSGVLAALNRRLSGNLKETKQQEDVSQFPTAVEPASQRSSTGLKPLRPYPCEFNDSSSH